MFNRYSVDVVIDNQGIEKGYAIFDKYQQDYIGDIYEDKWLAIDDCDIMNEGHELEYQ